MGAKMAQNKKVLLHIQKYGGITSIEAFSEYRITRLAARVFDLRKMGYPIQTIREVKNNADGQTIQYARYVLE